MSLNAAIDSIAQVSVTGVTRSYGIDDVRGVNRPDLPALLPLPYQGLTDEPLGSTFGSGRSTYFERHTLRHRLLISPVQSSNQGEAMAKQADLIDAYLDAYHGVTESLSGSIRVVIKRYEAGVVGWNGDDYYGADFFPEIWI